MRIPFPGEPQRQALTNGVYRRAAGLIAHSLGRSEIVDSICVRRSVAAGEADFGRSDIDLGIVLRHRGSEADDTRALGDLARKYQRIRMGFPWLGESLVHEPPDLMRWYRTDPYRASLDRRNAILLHGAPLAIPQIEIRPEHAIRRAILWLQGFLPKAVRNRNRRNLGKFLLEMWNAYATATGAIVEPYGSRQDARHALLSFGEQDLAASRSLSSDQLLSAALRLCERMLPPATPIAAIDRPFILNVLLLPVLAPYTLVILPRADALPPPRAVLSNAVILTPALLHLYLHFANPFAYWALPDSLAELTVQPPSVEAFVRGCRYAAAEFWLRSPGFLDRDTAGPQLRIGILEHVLPYLRNGEMPPPPPQLSRETVPQISIGAYYQDVYPGLHQKAEQLWKVLDELPDVEKALVTPRSSSKPVLDY